MIAGADRTSLAIHAALHGLDARRAAHESNVANVETPGYRAQRVEFESALQRAMETGQPQPAEDLTSITGTNDPARANGNNVNLAEELTSLTETALTQELLIRALNDKYGLIRTAVGQG